MVVEDEPEIYDVLLAMFELWGVEGVAFVDGAEALAWIDDVDSGRVRRELPELALLDIRLQEVTGPQIGARLRRSPVLGQIPIVLITAYHMSPDHEQAAMNEAQADLLMYKPLPSMSDLRRDLDTVIERRKKAARVQAAPHPTEAPRPAMPPMRSTVRRRSSTRAKPAAPSAASPAQPETSQPAPVPKSNPDETS